MHCICIDNAYDQKDTRSITTIKYIFLISVKWLFVIDY